MDAAFTSLLLQAGEPVVAHGSAVNEPKDGKDGITMGLLLIRNS